MPFLGVLTAYVNLALVERSGARKPPTTWRDPTWTNDAFLEFCQKTTRREGGQTVQFGFTGTHDNWRYYMPWVWANGGDMFDKDLKAVTLGDPPGLEGIQFLGDLITRHRVAPTPDELRELGGSNKPFQDGKTAMAAASVNAVATNRAVANLRWTVTAYPRGKKGVAMGGGGVGWFITAGSKLRDETWELLKVVLAPEFGQADGALGRGAARPALGGARPRVPQPQGGAGRRHEGGRGGAGDGAAHRRRADPGRRDLRHHGRGAGQIWAGKRSARESLDVIKQRVTPMLALERA